MSAPDSHDADSNRGLEGYGCAPPTVPVGAPMRVDQAPQGYPPQPGMNYPPFPSAYPPVQPHGAGPADYPPAMHVTGHDSSHGQDKKDKDKKEGKHGKEGKTKEGKTKEGKAMKEGKKMKKEGKLKEGKTKESKEGKKHNLGIASSYVICDAPGGGVGGPETGQRRTKLPQHMRRARRSRGGVRHQAGMVDRACAAHQQAFAAAACLRAITVPHNLAVQTATSLARFYEENYVFNNMAKNPLATPHISNMVPINPYTKGVDVPAKLNAMAAAWPVDQL
ncbi:hypothetical protein FOA52_008588 [Chlamydomonas sp. UWO 241]|nr:hypothetical protein FOA52_008588 [Chlamydomonas sp. UWO 241]